MQCEGEKRILEIRCIVLYAEYHTRRKFTYLIENYLILVSKVQGTRHQIYRNARRSVCPVPRGRSDAHYGSFDGAFPELLTSKFPGPL